MKMMNARKMLTALGLTAACITLLLCAPASYAQEKEGNATTPPSAAASPALRAESVNADASAESIRQEIRRILDRPDFRLAGETQARPLPRWMQWIRDAWRKFWSNISQSGERIAESAPWFPYAIVAIAGAALLVMTWRIISESFFEGRIARAGKGQGDNTTPAKLLAAASAAYADGDVQRAIRLLFSAAILSLFGDAAKTTPTYLLSAKLALIEGAPQDDFRQLKHSFDVTFYGGAAAGKEDYENARRITMKLCRVNEEVEDGQ